MQPRIVRSTERGAVSLATVLALATLAGAVTDDGTATPLADGHRLFLQSCAGCHGSEGRGDGPEARLSVVPPANLRRSDVFGHYADHDLVAFVREGRRLRLALRPGAFRDHAAETEALVSYVRDLATVDWRLADAGEDLYLDRCTACHDQFGAPQPSLPPGVQRPPRDLSQPEFQRATSDSALRTLVRHGKERMPALVPQLPDSDAIALVAYVRLLSAGHTRYIRYCETCHGPHGEGAYGVAAEAGAPQFAFDARWLAGHPIDKTRRAVWHMLRDAKPAMPHFSYVLTQAQAGEIVRYLRSLPTEPTPDPAVSPGPQ